MTPRTTIEPARSANAATVSQRDGRESGEGAAKSAGPDAATAARDSTNEPVATPAQAVLGAVMGASTLARARRPFASSTACPIAAAKAKTSRTVPIAKSAWVSASMSGRGCASGRRAGRSQRRHRVVDLQDEAARAARVDERRAPGAALGADDRGVAPAHRAAGRPGWQDQPIERAIR